MKETWQEQENNTKRTGMKLPCLRGEDKGSSFSQDVLQVKQAKPGVKKCRKGEDPETQMICEKS